MPEGNKGSFIDLNKRQEERAQRDLHNTNKKLKEQQALLQHKGQEMQRSQVGVNPLDMLMLRVNLLAEWLCPGDPDENGDFGNIERAQMEVCWNDITLAIIDEMLKQVNKARLLQGVGPNGQQPGGQAIGVDMASIAMRVIHHHMGYPPLPEQPTPDQQG